ncbi:uncharacterized protein SAMN05444392_106156 [Seinonella peptonophila]|uniref:S1 motif domain-containing protein n=1 Tax=Seinonella peptonophila TaxID=112248 RepID=A0A1M4YCH0_9BACL|nr:Tex family protein [Seinonella peptonophila]SHF03246.1 uncharacterized protein SAMN05444392_106156 [Seinonella peptonophila]
MEEQLMLRMIAEELKLRTPQVTAAVHLLTEGNTIPFIARYRKEQTGELDEEQLRQIEERYQYLTQLNKRREEIIRLIDEQGKLTDELRQSIDQAVKLQELEDLYLPYRPKRKTRASKAREKGLEPLARILQAEQDETKITIAAEGYIDEELEVHTAVEALQGAMDILAEELAENAEIRKWLRQYVWEQGQLVSVAKDPEVSSVYEMYYDYHEPVRKMPSHRVLAVQRGEREEILRVKISVPEELIFKKLLATFSGISHTYINQVVQDSYKRLLAPAIEREIRNQMLEHAEEQAIHIFAENLRHLLLQPPLAGRTVLGVDPAFRTGCKLAVVDETGKLLTVDVIYPTTSKGKVEEAKQKLNQFYQQYPIDLIVIGNGTASRETEMFIAEWLQEIDREIYYLIVNEAGASVYSASKLAKEEFPTLDVAERSAISIARRVQDPLAELVKIDPKSVGVGQYQHDVSQKRLSESLGFVVESAVNYVGVDVNTASSALLQYVSGISKSVANNIVLQREEKGRFQSRHELKNIPRLGAKTYEQCIGFLRINSGDNPLDRTAIHPESYPLAEQLLSTLQLSMEQIGTNDWYEKLRNADVEQLAEQLNCGLPTLRDMIDALRRPGRDPREDLPAPLLRSDVLKLEDLKVGMELKGTVRNVVDFGAFVDIGLKNDGLVHLSKMSDRFIRHPMEVVTVGDIVTVWVLSVDEQRGRVSLSMLPVH